MKFRPTQSGYQLSEVVSALQKEVRRGKEREAMFWALELTPLYERYLWRRLLVIVNEDIGLANVNAIRMVPEFRRQYFEFRAYGRGGFLPLANCILMMCRSPKARLADEFLACTLHERATGLKLEIPDYALDKHTLKGKRAGRGLDHWLEEGCVLNPPAAEEFLTYHEEACQRWKAEDTKLDISGYEFIGSPEWEAMQTSPSFPKFALPIKHETLGDEIGRKAKKK